MKNVIIVLFLMAGLTAFGQGATAEQSPDIPARLEVKVFQLKGGGLSQPYLNSIHMIVQEDYSPRANVQYDREKRVLVVSATPITLEKVERFLNKVDVPSERLSFMVLILKVNGSGFDDRLDRDVVKELKEIQLSGADILHRARLETVPGQDVSVSMAPDGGDGYQIGFRPDGRRDNLQLSDFMVFRLVRSADAGNKPVYDQWKVLQTALAIDEKTPVVIGISGKDKNSVILAVKLVPEK